MAYKKTSFKKKKIQTKYSKVRKKIGKKSRINFLKIILYFIFLLALFAFLLSLVLYKKYIVDLPSVKELENIDISESSTIYDREGNELYKIFKENRTYIPYEDINPKMINALVAGEDKRFWDNPGFDLIGLTRAVIYRAIGKTDRLGGTSTLTQQLIRNTIIGNERKIERKIKEIYLSYKLTNGVSKEKILELYLNKIGFGSNAYGIEQAAKTFFGVSASELGILQSSILASLPKGPTYYSPYNHYGRVMGYPYTYNSENTEEITRIISKKSEILNLELLDQFRVFIRGLKAKELSESKLLICGMQASYFKANIRVDNEGCSVLDYSDLLIFLNSIRIQDGENFIEYQTGRKDFILGRMLEDNYISFEEYKNALLDSLLFEFNVKRDDITYPHFVFYVKEYLEDKYGQEILESGGFQIYTTIDPELQDKAQEIIENQTKTNAARFDANNAALLSLDNKNGEILAMVGGVDYFDTENGGNNNMMMAKLQPGSTFKPFVYSLALGNNRIGTHTPVYDVETTFPGDYTPANFDGEFSGKMTISEALNYSRNIPAIKMFFLAGGEKAILNFMTKLGVESLNTFKQNYAANYGRSYSYGAPLGLGTGEMTGMELARAYSVFANMGELKKFTPILKIIDSNGVVIESNENPDPGKQVIGQDEAFIINDILADTTSRPSAWNSFLTIPNHTMAAKTGTSTKQYKIRDEKFIFPRNLWTVGYTPHITTVAWAGNTDGTQLGEKGNGLEGAGSIVNAFMAYAHREKTPTSWKTPSGMSPIPISGLSGLLPNSSLLNAFLVSGLFINNPVTYDNSLKKVEIDGVCSGPVTAATPKAAIRDASLLQLSSLQPTQDYWETPVQDWIRSNRSNPEVFPELQGHNNIIFNISASACEHQSIPSDIDLRILIENGEVFQHGPNYIELGYQSSQPIIALDVLIDGEKVSEIALQNKLKGSYRGNITLPTSINPGNHELGLRVVDKNYNSVSEFASIRVDAKDRSAPNILLDTTPITLGSNESYTITGTIEEKSNINAVNVLLDGNIIARGINSEKNPRALSFILNRDNDIAPGSHTITFQVIDSAFNTSEKSIDFEIEE